MFRVAPACSRAHPVQSQHSTANEHASKGALHTPQSSQPALYPNCHYDLSPPSHGSHRETAAGDTCRVQFAPTSAAVSFFPSSLYKHAHPPTPPLPFPLVPQVRRAPSKRRASGCCSRCVTVIPRARRRVGCEDGGWEQHRLLLDPSQPVGLY
jgi:hypothetical protein